MINFNYKNWGHALASFFKTAAADAKAVAAKSEVVVEKIEGDKTVIEGVSAAIATGVAPGSAPVVIGIEDAAFAVLGAFDKALKDGGLAAEKNFIAAGIDQTAIDSAKAVGAQSVTFYNLIKSKV